MMIFRNADTKCIEEDIRAIPDNILEEAINLSKGYDMKIPEEDKTSITKALEKEERRRFDIVFSEASAILESLELKVAQQIILHLDNPKMEPCQNMDHRINETTAGNGTTAQTGKETP